MGLRGQAIPDALKRDGFLVKHPGIYTLLSTLNAHYNVNLGGNSETGGVELCRMGTMFHGYSHAFLHY